VPFVHGIRYREVGRGSPPVLLVHGAGGSSAGWLMTLHRLARVRRAVAFDLPGHGRSSGAVTTVEDWVQSIGQTAAGLCLGRSILVGHSLGGLAVLGAALAFPDKVAGLVLVTTAARIGVSPRLLERIERDWAHWHETIQEMAHSPDTPLPVRRRSTAIAFGASQAQTLADFRAASGLDLRGRLGEIATPTLVISGTHDLMIPPKWSAALAEGIPGAKHVALASAGHFPMHEQPDAFGRALADFIDTIRA
jgi:pimeloyl-ACP methyl ester carboxylesterase